MSERYDVITLSPDVRARYVEEELDELEGFARSYENRFRESVAAESPDGALSINEKATMLLASALAGSRQLTWAMIHAINGDLAPALFLSARAQSELTGLVAYFLREFRRYPAGALTAEQLDSLLSQLIMGTLHGREELALAIRDRLKAIRVGKFIEAVDDLIDGPHGKGLFKDCYGRLSEACHPNVVARTLISS